MNQCSTFVEYHDQSVEVLRPLLSNRRFWSSSTIRGRPAVVLLFAEISLQVPTPKKTGTQQFLNHVPVVGNGLAQDAATSGLALLMEEIQARFLGNTEKTEWVLGDAISEAPPISLLDFLQYVAAADAYKFHILGYNCHHYLAALTARMAAAMARMAAGPRMVYTRFDKAKKEHLLEEVEVDIQKDLLEKLVDIRGFPLLHGRMVPEALFLGGGMAKLTFDEEGKLIFYKTGVAVQAREDQTFLPSDMDVFFDTERKPGQQADPVCTLCRLEIFEDIGHQHRDWSAGFHCNGCGPEGETHWLHSECLGACIDESYDQAQVDNVVALPGGRAPRSAIPPAKCGDCCTGSIAGLTKFLEKSRSSSDIKYQQGQHA